MRVYNFNENNKTEPISDGLINAGSKYKSKFSADSILNLFRDNTLTNAIVDKIFGKEQQSTQTRTNNFSPNIPDAVPQQEKESLEGPESPLRSTVASGKSTPVRKGDSTSDVLTKLYSLLKVSYDKKKKEKEISDLFWEHYEAEKERRHKEFLAALSGITGVKPEIGGANNTPVKPGGLLNKLAPSALQVAGRAISNVFGTFLRAGRANVVIAAMMELTREAETADLNNEKQGITEPIKKTIEKLTEGDYEGAFEEIKNFNVYSAAAKTGLEFSKIANEATGKAEQIKKIRESNLDPEKDSKSTQFFKGESWDKSVKHYEKMLETAPDKDKDAIRKVLESLKKSAPTANQIPTPPPSERVVAGSKEYADNQLPVPESSSGTNYNQKNTAIVGGDTSNVNTQSGVRNPENTVRRVNEGTTVPPR